MAWYVYSNEPDLTYAPSAHFWLWNFGNVWICLHRAHAVITGSYGWKICLCAFAQPPSGQADYDMLMTMIMSSGHSSLYNSHLTSMHALALAGGRPLVVADPTCESSQAYMQLGAAVVTEVAKLQAAVRPTVRCTSQPSSCPSCSLSARHAGLPANTP